jgi:hypothetical protein
MTAAPILLAVFGFENVPEGEGGRLAWRERGFEVER